jgi:hypothetical protein
VVAAEKNVGEEEAAEWRRVGGSTAVDWRSVGVVAEEEAGAAVVKSVGEGEGGVVDWYSNLVGYRKKELRV